MTHDAPNAFEGNMSDPVRRGPGRPPGSPNRPKPPLMSSMQRQALKAELGASYKEAILARALAETRTRGLTNLIRARLGRDGLAEVQAAMIAEVEAKRQDEETRDAG